YNVLAIAAPALTGFTAFLLCRHLSRSFWPSVVGGYLFGFSTYEIGQMQGHLNLVLPLFVPLAVLLVLKRVEGTFGDRAFVVLLALVLIGQFSISTEIFATMPIG